MAHRSPAVPFASPRKLMDDWLHDGKPFPDAQIRSARKQLAVPRPVTLICSPSPGDQTSYRRYQANIHVIKTEYHLVITGEIDDNDISHGSCTPQPTITWLMDDLGGFSLGSDCSALSALYYEERPNESPDNCISLEFNPTYTSLPAVFDSEGTNTITFVATNPAMIVNFVALFHHHCQTQQLNVEPAGTAALHHYGNRNDMVDHDSSMALHDLETHLNDVTLNGPGQNANINNNTNNNNNVNNNNNNNRQSIAALLTSRARASQRFSFKPTTAASGNVAHITPQHLQLVATLQEQNQKYQRDHKRLQLQLQTAKVEMDGVRLDLNQAHSEINHKSAQIHQQLQQMSQHVAQLSQQHQQQFAALTNTLSAQYQKNKQLVNALIESQGNIRVYVRVRPLLPHEIPAGSKDADVQKLSCVRITSELENLNKADENNNNNKLTFLTQKEDITSILGKELGQYTVSVCDQDKPPTDYAFEHVFGPESTQEDVTQQVLPFVLSVVDGYNVCVCAYGQSGSGKTHTVASPTGVNYTAITRLFLTLQERQQHLATVGVTHTFSVEVSAIEIYNEVAKDLLTKEILDISFVNNCASIKGLKSVPMRDCNEVRHTLENKAYPNRAVGSTNLNSASSRSHLLIFVNVKNVYHDTLRNTPPEVVTSRMVLIDLAGSERQAKSGVQGAGLTEAIHINKSLSTFGSVLNALQTGAKHIPYRDSKLTMLLADSLSGDSKVLMFCNISPALCNAAETNSSLMFAQRAQKTSLGKASRNVTTDKSAVSSQQQQQQQQQQNAAKDNKPSAKELELQEQVKQLQQQLQQREQKVQRLENELKNSTPNSPFGSHNNNNNNNNTTTNNNIPQQRKPLGTAPLANKRTTMSSASTTPTTRPPLSRQESADNRLVQLPQIKEVDELPPSADLAVDDAVMSDLATIMSTQPKPISAKKRKSKDRSEEEIKADETPTHVAKFQRTALGQTPSKTKPTTSNAPTATAGMGRTTMSSAFGAKPLAPTTANASNRITMSSQSKLASTTSTTTAAPAGSALRPRPLGGVGLGTAPTTGRITMSSGLPSAAALAKKTMPTTTPKKPVPK